MELKIKKAQRSSLMGNAIFQVEVRAVFTSEETELIKKYGMQKEELYTSEDRKRHLVGASLGDTSTLRGAGSVLSSMVKSALSLKVTVNDLVAGKVIEAKNLAEVSDAVETIIQAGKNLVAYLELAKSFDGRELTIDLST